MTAMDIAVANNRAYTVDAENLGIIDVTNPAAPVLLSSTNGYNAEGVAVSGNSVFLATPRPEGHFADPEYEGVHVIDVTNPAQPEYVNQIIVPGTVRHLRATTNHVYVGDSVSAIDIIKIAP
jgi:hypothetical protein